MASPADDRWQLAEQLLQAARHGAAAVLDRRDRGQITVEVKERAADGTPVDFATDADHAAELVISDYLAQARPTDGFQGEERNNDRRGTSGVTHVVDPLDGTFNFVERQAPELLPDGLRYGNPTDYAVALAARQVTGDYLAAAIVKPETGEFAVGTPHRVLTGAVLDARDPASDLRQTGDATMARRHELTTTTNISRKVTSKEEGLRGSQDCIDMLEQLSTFRADADTGSSACNTLNLLTPGRGADALWLRVKGEHDRAPALALVPGAGGTVVPLDHGPFRSVLLGPAGATEQLGRQVQARLDQQRRQAQRPGSAGRLRSDRARSDRPRDPDGRGP